MKPNHVVRRFEMMPRRRLAQICFFFAGVSTVAFFAGVELWAREILLALMGAACLLEGSCGTNWSVRLSKGVWITGLLLIAMAALSLLPWPSKWVEWLSPGQARLLRDMEVSPPAFLHLSMDPSATWQSLSMLLAMGSTVYLTWYWSMDHRFRRRFRYFVLLLGALTALLGVLDNWSHSGRIYGLRATEFTGHWGPFVNRNHFADYMVLCGIFGLGMFFHHIFPLESAQRNRQAGIAALVISVLCLGSAVMAASRGAMLGLAAGLLVLTLLLAYHSRSSFRVRVMCVCVAVGMALVLTYGRNLLHRVEPALRDRAVVMEEGRWGLWGDVWRMGVTMRGRGIGVGAFETVFPSFQRRDGQNTFTHVENDYLQAWVEWGPVGGLLWGVALAMIGRQAWLTTTRRRREWQMGGWAALVALAVHAGMDFPLHIPANAWLGCLLLGMCLHQRSSDRDLEMENAGDDHFRNRFNPVLIMLGVLACAGMLALWGGSRRLFNEIETGLARRDFKGAWTNSQTVMRKWPFYWRSYVLAGASAAGLPSRSRDVERFYRTAQRLAQVNPDVSWQAGVLFFGRSPSLACDFFETAIAISEAPHVEMQKVLNLISERKGDFLQVASIGLRSVDRWEAMYSSMRNQQVPEEVVDRWLAEGRQRWLMDPVQRVKVMGPLVEKGRGRDVVDSFKRIPPRRPREEYWYGRGLESISAFEAAVQIYRKLWEEGLTNQLVFRSSVEINDLALRRAALKTDDIKYQAQVAESLAAQSRHADASKCWGRVLTQEPNNQLAWYGYALGVQASGDSRKTCEVWRKLVDQFSQASR
jgi:tetratricopeptide (TPR) repeat protein